MNKTFKIHLIAVVAFILLFLVSYASFQRYKPSTIKEVEDIKGLKTERVENMPLPEGAERTSYSKSSDTEILTFHIKRTKEYIQDFYRNIYISNKWELESQSDYNEFIVTRYKNEGKTTSVLTFDTETEGITLVSLETSN